jgi:hypothetical protein
MAGPKLIKRGGERVEARNIAQAPSPIVQPPIKLDFKSGGADADVSFSFTGMDDLATLLLSAPGAVRQACGYEMADIAHEVIALSKDEYVPRDTMALYDSANADEYDPRTDAGITQIGMWYAAPGYASMSSDTNFVTATDKEGKVIGTYRQSTGHGGGMVLKQPEKYALEQHENMEYDHHGIGGPKYLERPFMLKQPEVFPRLAAVYAQTLGKLASRHLGTDASTFAGTFGKDFGI